MDEIRVQARWRAEADDWRTDGAKLVSVSKLTEIRRVLEDVGVVIVEHRFYRGSTAPERMFFEDYEAFIHYIRNRTAGGDSIYVWSYEDVCRADSCSAFGKIPDLDGAVPSGGAY